MTDVSGNAAASEPTTFEVAGGCIMFGVPIAVASGWVFGPLGVYVVLSFWLAVLFAWIFVSDDTKSTSELAGSLLERVCPDSLLRSKFFHGPIFFRGIRFSAETATQIAASYDHNKYPLRSHPSEANCIFRDAVTGLVFHIETDHYGRRVTWVNDPDELFELISDIGVDVRDFDEAEIDRCRFVPGPITRELIKASRGSEPITDEQWERITKRR